MEFLKGKAKLAYEAFARIEQGKKLVEEGKKLIEEGKIELSSVIPEGKLEVLPVASKMLRRPSLDTKKSKRRSPRSVDEICGIIMKGLDTKPAGLTVNAFKLTHGLNSGRVKEARNKLISSGKISIIDDGVNQKMVKIGLDKK